MVEQRLPSGRQRFLLTTHAPRQAAGQDDPEGGRWRHGRSFDHDARGGLGGSASRQGCRPAAPCPCRLSHAAPRDRRPQRGVRIGQFADRHVEGHLAEEGHVQALISSGAAVPKIWDSWPQWGQTKVAMFSTMPRIGISTRLNMETPRRASISARSWGVETMTAPASGVA